MTEAEWQDWRHPVPMLESLRGRATPRKLRLMSITSWPSRRYPPPSIPAFDAALHVAERFADGESTEEEREAVWACADSAGEMLRSGADENDEEYVFSVFVAFAAGPWGGNLDTLLAVAERRERFAPTPATLREVFGLLPFRPIAFPPDWRTDTAVTLARQMYDTRDFGAMPILADALQDAGCDSADVLDHCRGPGPHVRGCWVVDLVLGRE